ncbi:cupin domain-containing protein [Amycolatopsis jejuensis]|uniref:cupin domain-containing protein n=1 Tax=Amycolatopsis jejuensis TaxID=330084 RepID=UPI0006899BFD|nr:cupin domain-containing protein [Amycolatopsis jejuensis]
MDFVRRFEPDRLARDRFDHQPLADLESCLIEGVRMPGGSTGYARHRHEAADQLYYVLEGRMSLDLNGTPYDVEAGSVVFIPAGTPHHNENPHSATELHIDVMLPPPPRGVPLATPAGPDERGGPGTGYVRAVADLPSREALPGFHMHILADRQTESGRASFRLANVEAGSPGTPWHIHDFDQIYFILEGALDIDIADRHYRATQNDLVVLPAGVPHRNHNAGPGQESHLVLLVPEPEPGTELDREVEFAATGRSFG